MVWRRAKKRRPASYLDAQGFRANVGMMVSNLQGEVLLFRRFRQNSWQFPQGGIDDQETPTQAMFRELFEEVGLEPHHLLLLGETQDWYPYLLPKRLLNRQQDPFVGQKQKWFLLRLLAPESRLNFKGNGGSKPEFDGYRWVRYWYPLREIVNFKREAYAGMMQELAPILKKSLLDARTSLSLSF